MARNHSKRKLETYQHLACINQHFHALAHHIQELENMGLFQGPKMHALQGLTRELQSQISHYVTERLHIIEVRDMFEHGKTRIERDHHLNPDRPAFRQGDGPNQSQQPPAPEKSEVGS